MTAAACSLMAGRHCTNLLVSHASHVRLTMSIVYACNFPVYKCCDRLFVEISKSLRGTDQEPQAVHSYSGERWYNAPRIWGCCK